MSSTSKPRLSIRPVHRVSRSGEKRQRHRVPFTRIIGALVLAPSLQLIDIHTSDLSTGGMGFNSPISLRLGDQLVIAFPRDGISNLYLCRVRSIRWMKSLCYRVGVEFITSQRLHSGKESLPLAWLGLVVENSGFSPTPGGLLQKTVVG